MLRRVAGHRETLIGELLLHLRVVHRFVDDAIQQYDDFFRRSGMPTSEVVGTSGAVGARAGAPRVMGRSRPALICGSSTGRSRNAVCTCWPSKSLMAGAAPR